VLDAAPRESIVSCRRPFVDPVPDDLPAERIHQPRSQRRHARRARRDESLPEHARAPRAGGDADLLRVGTGGHAEASRIIAASMVLAMCASRLESSCGVFSAEDAESIAEIVAAAVLDEWDPATGCPFGMQIARIRRPDGLEWVELRVVR